MKSRSFLESLNILLGKCTGHFLVLFLLACVLFWWAGSLVAVDPVFTFVLFPLPFAHALCFGVNNSGQEGGEFVFHQGQWKCAVTLSCFYHTRQEIMQGKLLVLNAIEFYRVVVKHNR